MQQCLQQRTKGYRSKLLSLCRSKIAINPILWIPMTYQGRSHCIRWRLDWLPGGRPRQYSKHLTCMLNRPHVIECYQIHQRLCIPFSILSPLSFLLNKLPTHSRVPSRYADSWRFYWSIICSILFEIDQLQHGCLPQEANSPGGRFLR